MKICRLFLSIIKNICHGIHQYDYERAPVYLQEIGFYCLFYFKCYISSIIKDNLEFVISTIWNSLFRQFGIRYFDNLEFVISIKWSGKFLWKSGKTRGTFLICLVGTLYKS